MGVGLSYAVAATIAVIALSFYFFRSLWSSQLPETAVEVEVAAPGSTPEPATYIKDLAAALPDSVILPRDVAAFAPAMKGWFSSQNRDAIPACFVRPRNVEELSTTVKLIQAEHTARTGNPATATEGLFAIRAGGANPANGISGVENGVVIDLTLIREVEPSEDGRSELEKRELGVVGGRVSPVGVGGSTLQGGMSFWSAAHGFMCSNVISYQVVLADGSIVTASAEENADLWRALKGGGNNFGVVCRFKLRSFPVPGNQIWAGSFVTPGFLHKKTIKAFHDHAERSADPSIFDERASSPILSLSYLTNSGITAHFNHIAYTKPTSDGKWPEYWAKSPLHSLWRFQSTHKNRTVRDAVVDFGEQPAKNNRNVYGTTTIKNDLATMRAVYQAWSDAIPSIKHVKDCMFIYVMQVVLPQWANKGDANVLGLEECKEPLIIVSFAVNWLLAKDDAAVQGAVRRSIEQIDEVAAASGTAHPYRFSNYASEWQRPLHGYGAENMRFMQGVSDKYDPEGLFRTGCLGGFKLDKWEGTKNAAHK
ncbi:hypothetical protein ACHAQA_008598 [Verticillium albo-atrum]